MRTNLARQVADNLKLRDVMEFYGVRFNSRGFAKCPFHSEKTASLSIKNEHYKCFGCGVYGGVIDFVMNYHGIGFTQAIVKLDSDFQLGLVGRKPTRRERDQEVENRRIERAFQAHKKELHQEYLTLCKVHAILFRRLCDGEEWLEGIVERLDWILDDFTGGRVRMWPMIMMQ